MHVCLTVDREAVDRKCEEERVGKNLTLRSTDETEILRGLISADVTHTHISCRHQRIGQHGDVVVSVEPRDEQHAESHVHQERHQDVGFPADRQTDRLLSVVVLGKALRGALR